MKTKQSLSSSLMVIFGMIVLIPILTGCSSSDHTLFDDTIQKTSAFIKKEMKDKNAVGLSIALVSDDKIVWSHGFGWADKENEIPATADSVYMLGSGTKNLTAVTILKLQEQGLIPR